MPPFLTDHQYSLLSSLFPPTASARGRPPLDPRPLLDALLWKLSLGLPWDVLPPEFPPTPTLYRRYRLWQHSGLLAEVLHTLFFDLMQRGRFDPGKAYQQGLVALQPAGRTLQVRFASSLLASWKDGLSPSESSSWQERTARLFYLVAMRHADLLH